MSDEWYFAFTRSRVKSNLPAGLPITAWAKKTPFPAEWDSCKALTSCGDEDIYFEIGMDEASAKAKLESSLPQLETDKAADDNDDSVIMRNLINRLIHAGIEWVHLPSEWVDRKKDES